MICLCCKNFCCQDAKSDKYIFSSKGLNKTTLEETGDGPMEKNRRVMDEIINLTSTNRRFRTINHCVATYEQKTRKGLSYFNPKRVVLAEGMHTEPLKLKLFYNKFSFCSSLICDFFYYFVFVNFYNYAL